MGYPMLVREGESANSVCEIPRSCGWPPLKLVEGLLRPHLEMWLGRRQTKLALTT